MKWLDGIIYSMNMNLSKFLEIVKDREAWNFFSPWGCKELDTTEQLNNNKVVSYMHCQSIILKHTSAYAPNSLFPM